ncbi:MAG: hypothetical protein ACI915_004914 [Gammaproteobacteria bacterium]|jgi:hypothetical protein
MKIPVEIQDLIANGALAHLSDHRKLKNIRRDPRVAISLGSPTQNKFGLDEFAVLYGDAPVEVGGAPALLRRLADIYMKPDSGYPPADAPEGYITRVKINRIAGVGPWAS